MAKFKLSVSIGLVGCKNEREIEIDDEDVPEDIVELEEMMLDELWQSGMLDWTYERIDEGS